MERRDVTEAAEKVWEYVKQHHQTQAPTVARALIISKSKAAKALEELEQAGLVEKVNKKFYARRDNATEAR
jgi:Mn-dependent DtxR family transcriptional regulator